MAWRARRGQWRVSHSQSSIVFLCSQAARQQAAREHAASTENLGEDQLDVAQLYVLEVDAIRALAEHRQERVDGRVEIGSSLPKIVWSAHGWLLDEGVLAEET